MLFERETLTAIEEGRVTVAFRRWRRPTVRAGGTLTAAVGVLSIDAVEEVADVGLATPRFEVRVRKLEGLGLTERLEVGDRPSPRGAALLRVLEGKATP